MVGGVQIGGGVRHNEMDVGGGVVVMGGGYEMRGDVWSFRWDDGRG